MKSFLKLSLLASIASLAVSAFAQTNPAATQSQGVAVGRAIQTGRESSAWVNVAGQIGSTPENGKFWTPNQGADVVLANCRFTGLSVQTVSPDNEVTVQVVVVDGNGHIVLEGHTRTRPTQASGQWTLPASAAEIALSIPYYNYVELEADLGSAYLIVPRKEGGEDWYRLAVDGKNVIIARDSLGLKGGAYIRANFKGGKTGAILVETGAAINVSTIIASTNPKISNLVTGSGFQNLSIDKPGTWVIPTLRGQGVSPAIEVNQAAAGSILMKVTTSEGKSPIGFRIVSPTGQITSTVGIPTSGGLLFPVSAGRSYVVALFKAGDCDEPSTPIQTGFDDTGKGEEDEE